MEYVALFFTQFGAIKFEKSLNKKGIQGTMMPVPRKLSSSCGISVKFNFQDDIASLICNDINKIYESDGKNYNLVYHSE